jgi:hypothetical protein
MMALTSSNLRRASSVGDLRSGSMFLKTRKVALGCWTADERKVWSGRRNETRFNGEPWGC